MGGRGSAPAAPKELLDALVELGRTLPGVKATDTTAILSDRSDGPVVRVGDVVVKAHEPDVERGAIEARVALASRPEARDVLLRPISIPGSTAVVCDRVVSAWPAGDPVDPEDPDAAPWEEAARLLATLHRLEATSIPGGHALPPAGGPGRVARALSRLESLPASAERDAVERAYATLPPWANGSRDVPPVPGRPRAIVHGDLHLGQLVRASVGPGAAPEWRLIDVDDVGLGDPAWDLARPAAWFIIGLVAPETWSRFVAAYLDHGGNAIADPNDLWASLEVPARAVTIQSCARALFSAHREARDLDEVEESWLEACLRMTAGASG